MAQLPKKSPTEDVGVFVEIRSPVPFAACELPWTQRCLYVFRAPLVPLRAQKLYEEHLVIRKLKPDLVVAFFFPLLKLPFFLPPSTPNISTNTLSIVGKRTFLQ